MAFADESYNLRIELDTKHCELSAREIQEMELDLAPLRKVTRDFPVSDLYITLIRHPRSQDYHVKTSLRIPSRILFTGDRDTVWQAAYKRCVRKLVRKVEGVKQALGDEPERKKYVQGKYHDVVPSQEPDVEALQAAVAEGDYATFYRSMLVYEPAVRQRVGRWIERYPQLEAQLDDGVTLDDLVEEVFLNAFERFERRPHIRLGEWLEELIDDSTKAFVENPDAEKENLRFVRTYRETESGR